MTTETTAGLDTSNALMKLSKKHGTLTVLRWAKEWIAYVEKVQAMGNEESPTKDTTNT